jgi:hypothetical protein
MTAFSRHKKPDKEGLLKLSLTVFIVTALCESQNRHKWLTKLELVGIFFKGPPKKKVIGGPPIALGAPKLEAKSHLIIWPISLWA